MEADKVLSEIMGAALSRAKAEGRDLFTPEQVLLESLDSRAVFGVLERCGCDIGAIRGDLERYIDENVRSGVSGGSDPDVSVALGLVCAGADRARAQSSRGRCDVFDLILAMLSDARLFCSYTLRRNGLERLPFLEAVSELRRREGGGEGSPRPSAAEGGQALPRFAVDMTARAASGAFDPLVGRTEEVSRAMHVLCRRTKNNPVFVGDPGVGKTAVARGLAARIASGDVPARLRGARVFALDMALLAAGARFRGDLEGRLRAVLGELSGMGGAVLFIDEIHSLVGRDGGSDAASVLLPALADGAVRVMGATTCDEWSRVVERSPALARRLQKVDVAEPTEAEALRVVRGLAPRFAAFHSVRYTLPALRAAVSLSALHVSDRRLPDKALDAVDEAGALVSLRGGSVVGERAVREVLSKMAGIPVHEVASGEAERLRSLPDALRAEIFGQDEAVDALAAAVKKSRALIRDEGRPEGCFLFVGPTGVGKTELARALASALGVPLLRFDMSEYQEAYTVSRLVGSAPGYVGHENGGLLTEAVRRSPRSVVLFDEIEKAHHDVYNVLLQVMDYGSLTDGRGRKADFRGCMVIMTSNAGARELERGAVGFGGADPGAGDGASLREAVSREFPPEFRNRLDAVVPFSHLSEAVALLVARKCVGRVASRLASRRVRLSVSEGAVALVAREGYSREFGARNVARAAERLVALPLVDEVLFGRLSGGGSVSVSESGGRLEFSCG